MAGQPRFREFLVQMDERFGNERGFMEHIACGGRLSRLAEEFDVDASMFYRWLHKDEARNQRFREARKLSASVLADQALDLADDASVSQSAIVRERIRVRQWLAGVYDRDTFGGEKGGPSLTINIGDLHLDALKAHGGIQSQLPSGEEVPDAEYEVVEEGANPFAELG